MLIQALSEISPGEYQDFLGSLAEGLEPFYGIMEHQLYYCVSSCLFASFLI